MPMSSRFPLCVAPFATLAGLLALAPLAWSQGSPAAAVATWTTAAAAGVARQELYPEVLGGKIYVAGGLLSPNTGYSAHFEAYDPETDAWARLATLPQARHHMTLTAVGGQLYGVGGFTGGFPVWQAQPTMFIYDPARNAWRAGTDLATPRAEGIAAAVDGKLYLIGGRVRATPAASHFDEHVDSTLNEVFDPVRAQWSARAPAPTARNSAAYGVIGGKVYVVGGRQYGKNPDGTARQVNVPTLEVYDPATDTWATHVPMPQAQGGLAATVLDGKLYVFGGEQWVPEQKVFADSWVYDPATDRWSALPPLPTPRHGLGAATLGKRVHVFGGGLRTGGNAATAVHEVLVVDAGKP